MITSDHGMNVRTLRSVSDPWRNSCRWPFPPRNLRHCMCNNDTHNRCTRIVLYQSESYLSQSVRRIHLVSVSLWCVLFPTPLLFLTMRIYWRHHQRNLSLPHSLCQHQEHPRYAESSPSANEFARVALSSQLLGLA